MYAKKPAVFIFSFFLIWRVFLVAVVALAATFIPYRKDFAYTSYSYYLDKPLSGVQTLFEPWANFDGVHYLHIAQRGYIDEVRFFPLLPILIRLTAFGNDQVMLYFGFVVSQVICVVALFFLYKLLVLDYSPSIALKVILLLLTFPTSFFLGSVYTEGLFLLLSVLSFYAVRKNYWGKGALTGALLSSTRVTGIALVPSLLLELCETHKKTFGREWKKIGLILGASTGLLLFTIFVWKNFNDPLLFLKAHTTLGNSRSFGLVLPVQTCVRYLKILLSLSPMIFEWWIALLEVVIFLASCISLIFSWKMGIRKSYWLFTLLTFLIPTLSGTFTGLPRYVMPLFVLYMPLAVQKKRWPLYVYFLICVPLLVLLTTAFSRGYLVA